MNDIVFKYNGVELNITIQQVPVIIKMLCNENISIYEVYQPYILNDNLPSYILINLIYYVFKRHLSLFMKIGDK